MFSLISIIISFQISSQNDLAKSSQSFQHCTCFSIYLPLSFHCYLFFAVFVSLISISHYWLHSTMWSEVEVSQSCPTVCNIMDYTVHGILQARKLEWVAFSFSKGSSQPRDRTQVSHTVGGFSARWATRETHVLVYVAIIFYRIKLQHLTYSF